jgi:hypothetical protein
MMEPTRVDRVVDVASVVLISVAAVLSALCGYQAGRWSGEEARRYNVANVNRTHSVEASDRANMLTAIDVGMFLRYIDAIDSHDTRMAEFLDRRFRPEMRPALLAWLATKPFQNPRAPSSPFAMPDYSLKTTAESRGDEAQAKASFDAAVEANHHSDDFLLLTVIFAGVSFLAGISTKMTYPRHAIVVGIAFLAVIYGVIRLVALPFL